MLTPQAINGKAQQAKPVRIPADEWGGDFYVAQLNGLERDQLEEAWTKHKAQDSSVGIRAFFVAYGWCDNTNKRIVSTAELDTVAEKLLALPCGPLVRAFNVFCEINALLDSDVEELIKNSASATT